MRDCYKKVEAPEGTHIAQCPVCASSAEVYRYSESDDAPTTTAVMCANGDKFGPQDGLTHEGCLLYMPPENFYRGTIREAVKYWNEYAKALDAQRRARRWEAAKVLRHPTSQQNKGDA